MSWHNITIFRRSLVQTSTVIFSSPAFAELISRQLIDGILNVIRSVPDENERLDLMTDLFLFYIIGIMGMTMATS